jgi:hypothetical protein
VPRGEARIRTAKHGIVSLACAGYFALTSTAVATQEPRGVYLYGVQRELDKRRSV